MLKRSISFDNITAEYQWFPSGCKSILTDLKAGIIAILRRMEHNLQYNTAGRIYIRTTVGKRICAYIFHRIANHNFFQFGTAFKYTLFNGCQFPVVRECKFLYIFLNIIGFIAIAKTAFCDCLYGSSGNFCGNHQFSGQFIFISLSFYLGMERAG